MPRLCKRSFVCTRNEQTDGAIQVHARPRPRAPARYTCEGTAPAAAATVIKNDYRLRRRPAKIASVPI